MEQQSQINYRFILKRVLAYMIDIIVVTIIATLLSNVKFINNNTKEYQEMYQEFNELYKDYTNINVLINDEDYRIRQEIAKQGYGLNILINDSNLWIRKTVIKYCKEHIDNEECKNILLLNKI